MRPELFAESRDEADYDARVLTVLLSAAVRTPSTTDVNLILTASVRIERYALPRSEPDSI